MRFLGTDDELKTLKESQENLVDSMLMNAYNAGFETCNKSITELYNQAVAAISQNLVGSVGESNPFLNLLKVYIDNQHSMMAQAVAPEVPQPTTVEQVVEG